MRLNYKYNKKWPGKWSIQYFLIFYHSTHSWNCSKIQCLSPFEYFFRFISQKSIILFYYFYCSQVEVQKTTAKDSESLFIRGIYDHLAMLLLWLWLGGSFPGGALLHDEIFQFEKINLLEKLLSFWKNQGLVLGFFFDRIEGFWLHVRSLLDIAFIFFWSLWGGMIILVFFVVIFFYFFRRFLNLLRFYCLLIFFFLDDFLFFSLSLFLLFLTFRDHDLA